MKFFGQPVGGFCHPLQQQQCFALDNGSIRALRLVADPVAERPHWELLPPAQ